MNLDIKRVVGYRHFCNKIWNAVRFGLRYLSFGGSLRDFKELKDREDLAWEDRWILSRLSRCVQKTNEAMASYQFANATTATQSFFHYEFCDIYLELLKPRFYGEESCEDQEPDQQVAREVLHTCLDWSMRLLHPLLPYLTEELYQRLPPSRNKCESITIAPYPVHEPAWQNETVEKEMAVASEIAKQFRSQKASLGFPLSARPEAFVRPLDSEIRELLERLRAQISRMAGIGSLSVLHEVDADPVNTIQGVVNQCLIHMKVQGLDLSGEHAKLQRKMTSCQKIVDACRARMEKPSYEKVPASVREVNACKLQASETELRELRAALTKTEQAMRASERPLKVELSGKRSEDHLSP